MSASRPSGPLVYSIVADFSLDQACIYHLQSHHKIEYTAQNNTNFYTFIYASGTPSSRKKVNLTKGENSLKSYLHHKVGTRKKLHDIPRFLIFFLGQEILIIIYRICNICLPFQLLEISTGRHSNCFFSLNQRLSI